MDAALLLDEVKGQHSIEAELCSEPLKEGTLDRPNLKLDVKRGMKWYICVHIYAQDLCSAEKALSTTV